MSSPTIPMDNSSAIADSKVPPGDDYEEIREQVSYYESLKFLSEVKRAQFVFCYFFHYRIVICLLPTLLEL
jgi:hypothetical protein